MVVLEVSVGWHSRFSSPQQPAQRTNGTQAGLKMCSTSPGYSWTTSTSFSIVRQKLFPQTSWNSITATQQEKYKTLTFTIVHEYMNITEQTINWLVSVRSIKMLVNNLRWDYYIYLPHDPHSKIINKKSVMITLRVEYGNILGNVNVSGLGGIDLLGVPRLATANTS